MGSSPSGDEGGARNGGDGGPGPGWLEAGHLLGPGFRLVFTDRRGGVSEPPYRSLNLAFHTGDDPRRVSDNRAILAGALGIDGRRIAYPEQVHGLRVAWADDLAGRSEGIRVEALRETDGLLATREGLTLCVLTADCVPLAMAYPEHGIIAMLHAGWRGTLGDIAGIACRLVEERTGIGPSRARAVIGPCIGPCCYRVDEGRAELFVEEYPGEGVVVRRGEAWSLDLRRANIVNLVRCGMEERNIHCAGGCTCCEPRYFSFRREGVTGRQGALIWREREDG